ncbi:MAG: Membrane transport protein [Promethearchaeota archaeon]|nr:MAG: Membrane transport protein [Candidatus Lokiarchaeota archaeon]
MADINYIFFLSLSIIILGFIIKKLGIITEEDGKVIGKIIINVTLPALVLETVTGIQINLTLILLPIICIIYSLLVVALGFILFKNKSDKEKGVLLMLIIGYNIGLFAYPLIRGIYGETGLHYIAMFDMGNSIIIFGVAYTIGALFSEKINSEENKEARAKVVMKKLITSAPLLALIAALSINVSGLEFPSFISDLLDILSRANMALTLLLLGIYLNFKFEKEKWGSVLKILGIRYSLGIIAGVILYLFLPCEELYNEILLIAFILPIGMSVIPFTLEFDYDEDLAGMLVNLSIIISFGIMWLIVFILQ